MNAFNCFFKISLAALAMLGNASCPPEEALFTVISAMANEPMTQINAKTNGGAAELRTPEWLSEDKRLLANTVIKAMQKHYSVEVVSSMLAINHLKAHNYSRRSPCPTNPIEWVFILTQLNCEAICEEINNMSGMQQGVPPQR